MRNLIPILFAPILLGVFSFAAPQAGVGTLPVTSAGTESMTTIETVSISPDELPDTQYTIAPTVEPPSVRWNLSRVPGLVVTMQREGGGTEGLSTPPTVIRATWQSAGITIEVVVTQGPNEPPGAFHTRATAEVRGMLSNWPRDGAATGPHFP